MKINIKALELIEKGLSSKTVSKLSESQIEVLHKKLFVEQVNVSKTDTAMISKLKSEKKPFQVYEKEIDEDADLDDSAEKEGGYDPYAGNSVGNDNGPSNDDGFGGGDDGMGIFEEEKEYEGKPNPWAICHSQVGPRKSRKWERCVREVKKQLGEGKNSVSLFLENQIEKIVEKHMPPKITKGDLVKYLSEQNPATAPTTKPAPTKPGTKPGTKPRPAHPGKNPNPGENPAPKAKKVSPEDAKDKVIDVIMQLLEK
jgi:hypothetical protein